MTTDENKLAKTAERYMLLARSGDWEHAKRVVKWIKELGADRKDRDLLVAAGYIHDIGWSEIAPKEKLDMDEMLKMEPIANRRTPKLVREMLEKLGFSEPDIQIVIRLIEAADKHQSLLDDEEVIVDADNLAKLCVEHLAEKYKPDSHRKMIELWERESARRIKTSKARAIYPQLLRKLKEDLNYDH